MALSIIVAPLRFQLYQHCQSGVRERDGVGDSHVFLPVIFLLPFFLPLHHSHGVEKPVVHAFIHIPLIRRRAPARAPEFWLPLGSVPGLLHVFLDHLVDVVGCLASDKVF